MEENINILPWHITRAAAITSYILMFILIVLGETMASGIVYKIITPPRAWLIHKYLGISFGFTLIIHISSLLFDEFINFNLPDILIPFYSDFNPFFLSLGIVGFYFVLAILISSLISRFQRSSWWRQIHFLTYPLFVMGFTHGITIGTDSHTPFMLALYWFTGVIFVVLILHRWRLYLTRTH